MELDKIKQNTFQLCGWGSITINLFTLFMLNIAILTNYPLPFDSLFVTIALVLGVVALFTKTSRYLGIWGISLSVFIGLFAFTIFVLGWMINPFP